jgi:uncharacterized protein YqeY
LDAAGYEPLSICESDVDSILDPSALVQSRDSIGGSAYSSIMSMVARRRAIANELREQARADLARIENCEASVVERARTALIA